MTKLEDAVEGFEALNGLLKRASKLSVQGFEGLRANGTWTGANDAIEESIMLRATRLGVRNGKLPASNMAMPARTVAKLPMLHHARSLQALSTDPTKALREDALFHLHAILVELSTLDPRDHRVGSARASPNGSPSAFITNECIWAVLTAARSIRDTKSLVDFVDWYDVLSDDEGREFERLKLTPWLELERKRLAFSLHSSTTALAHRGLVDVESVGVAESEDALTKWADELKVFTKKGVVAAAEAIKKAAEELLTTQRSNDPQGVLAAVESGFSKITEASSNKEVVRTLDSVADSLSSAVQLCVPFLSSIVDRELALAHTEPKRVDAAELCFAVASLGSIQGWSDSRYVRALELVVSSLRSDGTMPKGTAFDTEKTGAVFHVIPFEVTRALCFALRNVPNVTVSLETATCLLRPFDVDSRPMGKGIGWRLAESGSDTPVRWVTGLALHALESVSRFLRTRINAGVLAHFSVKLPESAFGLHLMTYGDFGLTGKIAQRPDWEHERHRFLGFVVQHLRAHVCGAKVPADLKALHSLLVFGPPGTGKTTIAETLSATCSVKLVTVTPSDILVGGTEGLERNARAVFKALALLHDVVILFDEFDSIVASRPAGVPTSTIGFLTPGMLPKLKDLYDDAAKRNVCFILATNLINSLDAAAIRDGRFDCRVGVYPPDEMSRSGALVHAAHAAKVKVDDGALKAALAATKWIVPKKFAEFVKRFAKDLGDPKFAPKKIDPADDTYATNPQDKRQLRERAEVELAGGVVTPLASSNPPVAAPPPAAPEVGVSPPRV